MGCEGDTAPFSRRRLCSIALDSGRDGTGVVFGKEENADPPAWLAPYVESPPPTKKELQQANSARSQ